MSSPLDEILAEYLLAEERGGPFDRDAFLERHPKWAGELRAFFANHDQMRGSSANAFDQPTLNLASAVKPGAVIGGYQLLAEIGRGGMGVVYRARELQSQRLVAFKTFLPGVVLDASIVERFYQEAASTRRLDHNGIVPVYDVGEHQGAPYLAMALVEGETLADRIVQSRPTPMESAELLRRIALAIDHAHQRGVIHRDLKPANIMLDRDGAPRITDFGLAKRHDHRMTATGQILGTLAYMPPEQALGRNVDERADIYALGCILYSLLTGRAPFQSESQAELLLQVLDSEPPAPRSLNSDCPRSLEAICLRCLEKSPERRYAAAGDLALELQCVLKGEPLVSRRDSIGDRVARWTRRRPALATHLAAIGTIEALRHTKVWFGAEGASRPHEIAISLLLAAWAAACIAFQDLLGATTRARVAWALADLFFLTAVLTLVEGPLGPLPAAYCLMVLASGQLYRTRVVVLTTLSSAVAYVALIWIRPEDFPPHYALLFLVMLLVSGWIVGSHVRRLRLLDRLYGRDAEEMEGSRLEARG